LSGTCLTSAGRPPLRRILATEGPGHYVVLSRILHVNFYEKALFVKGRRGGLLSWPSATASALRAMLLSALVVSQLSSDSVHRMRSVLIRAPLRYCNLPSVLSSLRGGTSSHGAVTSC
jgi:hypothetical protein